MSDNDTKICFVIAPIGEESSPERKRSDQILEHIIDPVAVSCGYTTLRADKISEPGIITTQVIQHIIDDPLVVADLTGRNPNVFYELALRHALKKPTVQLISDAESIPFDVAAARTIRLDHTDLDSVAACRAELAKQIKATEENPSLVDNPISQAVELKSLKQSGDPIEKSNAEIISMLRDVRALIGSEWRQPRDTLDHSMVSEALRAGAEIADTLRNLRMFDETDVLQMEADRMSRMLEERVVSPLAYIARQLGIKGATATIRRKPREVPIPITTADPLRMDR